MVALQMLCLVGLASVPGKCREDFDALRYREAAEDCLAEVATASKEQLPEVYKLLGMSLATVGERDKAKEAFVSLLALDPGATLPDSSPKFQGILDEARREGAGQRVTLSVQTSAPAAAGGPWALSASVADGPLHPVTRLNAASGAQQDSKPRTDAPVVLRLAGPPGAPLHVDVRALDRFGGALATADLTLEAPKASRPLWLSWKAWGAGAAVLAVAGVGLGAVAQQQEHEAQSPATYAGDAIRLDASAHRFATTANVLYAAAAGLVVGTVVLLVTERP